MLTIEGYGAANTGEEMPEEVVAEDTTQREMDRLWLEMAQAAFSASDSYLNTSLRRQWETNYALFNNRHPPGSKYHSELYAKRSRIFRPRTRAAVRKNESAAAAAFFASTKLVSVEATDESDQVQVASAAINEQILQYRLSKTIRWFQTCIGAYQDAQVAGVCISKQYWNYRRRKIGSKRQMTRDPVTDEITITDVPQWKVERDQPAIDLFPPENIRIDAGADWRDPLNSSPYLIAMIPMYVCDVLDMIGTENSKTGKGIWREVTNEQLLQARTGAIDSIRQAREGTNRQDSKSNDGETIDDFDIVWVHENFIRSNGEDWHFYTLGTTAILSDPTPRREVYWHADKERPYALGVAMIEAHKSYPVSKVEMTAQLQMELNDTTNQRLDNVKLAMNGRNFVKTGQNVDLAALLRSVPGATILMNDPKTDVVTDRPPDVTGSAFQEQDRLNVEFDELAGAFSPASVQSNRKLNETVGGMQLLAGNASGMGEYDLRVFSETWVETVLRQLLRLCQKYETDPVVLALAGKKAQLWQRYGINRITDELLDQELTCNVDVGLAAVSPERRQQRFAVAAKMTADIFGPSIRNHINKDAVLSEIWGPAGYRDGSRFFKDLDQLNPAQVQIQQLEQVVQNLQKQLDDKMADIQARLAIADQNNATRLQVQELQNAGDARENLIRAQSPTKGAWPGDTPQDIGRWPGARAN